MVVQYPGCSYSLTGSVELAACLLDRALLGYAFQRLSQDPDLKIPADLTSKLQSENRTLRGAAEAWFLQSHHLEPVRNSARCFRKLNESTCRDFEFGHSQRRLKNSDSGFRKFAELAGEHVRRLCHAEAKKKAENTNASYSMCWLGVAQLVERLVRNEKVAGSIPVGPPSCKPACMMNPSTDKARNDKPSVFRTARWLESN